MKWLEVIFEEHSSIGYSLFSQMGYRKHYWVGYVANSWDEWVGSDRLLKHTEENVAKQQALEKKQGVDKSLKSGRSTKSKGSTGWFHLFNIFYITACKYICMWEQYKKMF